MVAALTAIQQNKTAPRLQIASDSQYTINTMSKSAPTWLDNGFEGVANTEIVSAVIGELMNTKTPVYLRKVKGHSGDEGNDGADLLANEGAMKNAPDAIDLSAGTYLRSLGARVNVLTQARAYRLIRARKEKDERRRMTAMVERAKAAALQVNGVEPQTKSIWSSLRKRKKGTLTQKFSAFAWKALHEGHKVGKYWKYIDEDRYQCQPCNSDIESLEHILQECRVSGQETVWNLAREAWAKTGLDWPEVTLELILSVGTIEIKNRNGKASEGRTRLFKILLTESAYLIWLLRCEWRIGREQN
ncbi:hypothetical protein DFP72DRAFT_822230 [Ephemerocybe angulata]|uniref:RNase H type-1 domain-containing protein n=1 Tax=Ephemerocybe angulata TaxID=980116 RepID=A0A8H6HHI5_9AGAR|nr:hypothetical protein DFP72DRAFT_822230 [Tulosesus angulatus]